MSDNLPPLPSKRLVETVEGHAVFGWVREDFETYARAAIEASRAAVPAGWVPVTQELLDSQEPWLYKPCWLALPSGSILQGVYEWRQGGNPDRFNTEGAGDLWAFDVSHVMPMASPLHPSAAAPQPVAQPGEQLLRDAITAMACDGWLSHGPEGMSAAQEKCYAAYMLVIGAQAKPEQAAQQWQPIETAPHGKSVLACNALGYVGRAVFNGKKWEHIGRPSHWMPLPALPKD